MIKKGPSHGARHGNIERQRICHAAHVSSKKKKKMVTNPYWTDSGIALVIEDHKSTSDGTKNTAHATMRSRPKITSTSLQRQSASDVKILGCLCSNVQVRTARRTIVKTTTKPSKSKIDFLEILAMVSQDSIPASSQSFAWHDEGTERVDLRTGWRWSLSTASSSSSSTWWISSEKWWQAWSWDEQCFFKSRCFAYKQWRCPW